MARMSVCQATMHKAVAAIRPSLAAASVPANLLTLHTAANATEPSCHNVHDEGTQHEACCAVCAACPGSGLLPFLDSLARPSEQRVIHVPAGDSPVSKRSPDRVDHPPRP
jgi:hypothetical protein